MKLDAHQHFWKYSAQEYGWITDEMAALKHDFLPGDLAPLLAANGFDGCIAVQAVQAEAETTWLLDLADQNDFIRGVVGWVNLCAPDNDAKWDHIAGRNKLVGVRHILQGEPDDRFMLRADFRRGIAQLAERGLAYDLLLHPRHLPVAVRLVRDFPGQHFVLDHIAKPPIAEGKLSPWEPDLRDLARCENVNCKVSGMVTEANWTQWRAEDFKRYLDVVFDAFGADRLMIGSDWPVCTLAADYAVTMGIAIDYIRQMNPEMREAVLGANCARFYRV
jgi:L-fuconolactonase